MHFAFQAKRGAAAADSPPTASRTTRPCLDRSGVIDLTFGSCTSFAGTASSIVSSSWIMPSTQASGENESCDEIRGRRFNFRAAKR